MAKVKIAVESKRKRRSGREIDHVIERFHAEHPEQAGEPLKPEMVAEWADRRGIVRPEMVDHVELLRRRIVSHLARATQIDPQGREVRSNAVNFEPVMTPKGIRRRSRWLPLFESPEEFAARFFQGCRTGAVADVVNYETTRESYNENNTKGGYVKQSSLDFTNDVAEKKLPTSWPSSAPPGDDEDDDKDPTVH